MLRGDEKKKKNEREDCECEVESETVLVKTDGRKDVVMSASSWVVMRNDRSRMNADKVSPGACSKIRRGVCSIVENHFGRRFEFGARGDPVQ